MARILIGNIKGPAGPTGPQGKQGIQGQVGPQGPLPPLINNALATQAGVAALDAVMGKTLQDQINQQNSDLENVVGYTQVDDANKAVKFGRYRVSGSGSNIPSWGGGVDLLVIPYETGVKAQIAIFNSSNPKFAVRAMSNGTYGNWIEYAQKDDFGGVKFYCDKNYLQMDFELNGTKYKLQILIDGGIKLFDGSWNALWQTALK